MNDYDNIGCWPVALMLICLAVFYIVLAPVECHSRWSGSRYSVSWGPLAGCRVFVNGQWMPEDRVRTIED